MVLIGFQSYLVKNFYFIDFTCYYSIMDANRVPGMMIIDVNSG